MAFKCITYLDAGLFNKTKIIHYRTISVFPKQIQTTPWIITLVSLGCLVPICCLPLHSTVLSCEYGKVCYLGLNFIAVDFIE